jgi:hypothetical protein
MYPGKFTKITTGRQPKSLFPTQRGNTLLVPSKKEVTEKRVGTPGQP